MDEFNSDVQIERLNWWTLLTKCPSSLALDISKSGTGVASWDAERQALRCGTFSLTNSVDHLAMRVGFRENILEIYKQGEAQKEYEHIVVEDVIGSSNFNTANILYQLNPIIDDMVYFKEVPQAEIHRIDNMVWRKHLIALAQFVSPISGSTDTKWIAQQCLIRLGVPEIWKNDNESDAIGMLIATLARDLFGFNLTDPNKSKKITRDIRKGHTIKQYTETKKLEAFLKKYNNADITRIRIEDNSMSDIITLSKNIILEHGNDKIMVYDVPKRSLGVLLTHKNIDPSLERSYVVVYHTSTMKERKISK